MTWGSLELQAASRQSLLSGLMAKDMSDYPARESLKEIWHVDYYFWSGTFEQTGQGEHEGL